MVSLGYLPPAAVYIARRKPGSGARVNRREGCLTLSLKALRRLSLGMPDTSLHTFVLCCLPSCLATMARCCCCCCYRWRRRYAGVGVGVGAKISLFLLYIIFIYILRGFSVFSAEGRVRYIRTLQYKLCTTRAILCFVLFYTGNERVSLPSSPR